MKHIETVLKNTNLASKIRFARDRMLPEVFPEITPSFDIDSGNKIFTIGSCFARNIEQYFDRLGFDVPVARLSVPKEEHAGPNSSAILNKYTPPAIYQEVKLNYDFIKNNGSSA